MNTMKTIAGFRPLSTQALCVLKLSALNPADTSCLAFNYYSNHTDG